MDCRFIVVLLICGHGTGGRSLCGSVLDSGSIVFTRGVNTTVTLTLEGYVLFWGIREIRGMREM